MISIDGSLGEGGGQILRTSLGLSMVTGNPFEIRNIRAKRKRPGMMRQHTASVSAACAVCGGSAEGNTLGSQTLLFRPGRVLPGSYRFAVGTAGSSTLVLQTVLPALLTAAGTSRLLLEGGTHNPFAPPFDFLARSFVPLLNRMGPSVSVALERYGFFPAGGGRFSVEVVPVARLAPLSLLRRGTLRKQEVFGVVSRLPEEIARDEVARIAHRLDLPSSTCHVQTVPSAGPGNTVHIALEFSELCEVITAFGSRRVHRDRVADEAAEEAERLILSNVPVGPHLADQLLVPLALAGAGSFVTGPPTSHTLTNIEVIRKFLEVEISCAPEGSDAWQISVAGG